MSIPMTHSNIKDITRHENYSLLYKYGCKNPQQIVFYRTSYPIMIVIHQSMGRKIHLILISDTHVILAVKE